MTEINTYSGDTTQIMDTHAFNYTLTIMDEIWNLVKLLFIAGLD